jgi:uncharacterized delta-60 repeat protein
MFASAIRRRRLRFERLERRWLMAIGDPDLTFSQDGIVTIPSYSGTESNDRVYDAAVQADNKVVSVGTIYGHNQDAFGLARVNVDGTRDTTFGNNGIVLGRLPLPAIAARSVAIQKDGKIVVGVSGLGDSVFVARFNQDGTLDTTFGESGTAIFRAPGLAGITELAISDDQQIVVTGEIESGISGGYVHYDVVVIRFNANGEVDSDFGENGAAVVRTSGRFENPQSLLLQANGDIVVAGYVEHEDYTWDIFIAQFNHNGTLKSSFGEAGSVVLPVANEPLPNQQERVAILPGANDQLLVFSNRMGNAGNSDFAITRLNPDGTLDATFGVAGTKLTPITVGSHDTITDAVLLESGKILVLGQSQGNDVLVRYNPDFQLDKSFDGDGIVFRDIFERGVTLVHQSSGHSVIAFQTTDLDFGLTRFDSLGAQDFEFGEFGLAKINFSDSVSGAVANNIVPWNDSYIVAGLCLNEIYVEDICQVEIALNGDVISQRSLSIDNLYYTPMLVRSADSMLLISAHVSSESDRDLFIRKMFKDGAIDSTFGDQGTVIVDVPEGSEVPIRAIVQADGSLLLTLSMSFPTEPYSSYEIIHVAADGQLDSNFGNAGRLSVGAARDVVALVQRDGAIITIKSNFDGSPAEVRRWTSQGKPDLTWGTNGGTTFPHYDGCSDAAFVPDEKILIGCYTRGYNLFARLDRSGQLDTDFGDDGIFIVPYRAAEDSYSTTLATFPGGEWLSILTERSGVAVLEAFDAAGALLARSEQKIGDFGSFLTNGIVTRDNDLVLVGNSTQLIDARFLIAKFEGPGGGSLTWSNPKSRWDVTGDDQQNVTPQDALVVINELNARGPHPLTPLTRHIQARAYYDVNDDSFVSSQDALMVINYLNRGGQAESESTSERELRFLELWQVYANDEEANHELAGDRSTSPPAPSEARVATASIVGKLDSTARTPKRISPNHSHDEYFQLLAKAEDAELIEAYAIRG